MLACADVERSLAFYRGLGLEAIVIENASDGAPRYARLRAPDGDGTLSLERAADAGAAAGGGGVAIYFECADLEARVQALRDGGYAFVSMPETKPWLWREAELRDPDGHPVRLYRAGSYRLDPPWRLPGSHRPPAGDLEPFETARNRGYGEAPIPSARDDELATYLEGLAAGTPEARDAAARELGPRYTATLLTFAERTATRAVREGRARAALLGLLAVGLSWREAADVRPAIPVLGVLHDAAARAGADPAALFTEAAALLPDDVAPVLRDFLTRPDLDSIAEEMGYAPTSDRHGFRYRRLWGAGQIDDDN
jgi:catechol 2,3-dioxygenase-like lactoylglutathione lyase family enzyme